MNEVLRDRSKRYDEIIIEKNNWGMNYNQVQSDKQRADKELMRALAEIDRLKFIVGEQ